nr:contactin-2-like [Ciona intestinalis]|eukprot:XP_026691271.1 contactin-2-like [Ciona intestinalis]
MRNKLRSCVFILLLSFSAANIFIEEPSDKLVPSDSTAIISFTCKANVVDPVYTWRKDGSPVDTADGSRFQVHGGTLEISNPQDSDAGDYQCVLSSVDGTVVSNYGKLVFGWVGEFSPSVNEPVTTVVGKGVSIKCPQPSYAPEHSVSFYWEAIDKNTRIQTPCNQSHYVSQTDGTLYIANPTAIDQDTLTCNVRSLWKYNGKPEKAESSIVPLTVDSSNVEFDPEFMLVPKPVTNAKRGGYAIIECFASGRPTPQLSWTKLDGPMPVNHTISEAGQLILKAVTEDMAGTYRCTAVNSKGSTHADGELRLEYAPQWTSPISSFSVDRTTSASIQCGAIAVPTPSFTWLKNGVVLGDSGNINIGNFDGGSQLDIYDVSEADQGMYQCVVSNSHGSIFSSAKMAVVSIPPTIIEPVPDITRAALDNEVIITCDIEAAPAAVIVWTKDTDQVLVIDNNKYTLQSDGLKISNLANGDAGVYNCYAENDMGNVQSEGTLQIYLPTVITTGPQGNEVIVGDLVQMGCQATHDNQLELTWSWTQNGEAISVFDKHYTISGDSILIKDVSSEQAGIYQCCANTDVGTDCASATVVVMAPPEPPTNVMVTNSYENTVTLQWQAGNDNGAAVDLYLVEAKCGFDCSWRFIVTSPIFVNTTTCQVKKLLPNNDYMFRVTAMNKYGTGAPSEPSAVYSSPPGAPIRHPIKIKGASKELGELVVQWQPMQPKYFGDNDISYKVVIRKQVRGDPVVLPVNLNDTNVPPVDNRPWIEQVAIGGTKNQTTFKVNASEIFVPYEVKVQAVNNYGPGPFSLMRVLHTAEKGLGL